MDIKEKMEIGKILDKYRIMSVQYYAEQDIYTIWFLDEKDAEACETIDGKDLD